MAIAKRTFLEMGPLHLEAGFGLYEGDNINGLFYAFEIVYDLPPSNNLIYYFLLCA